MCKTSNNEQKKYNPSGEKRNALEVLGFFVVYLFLFTWGGEKLAQVEAEVFQNLCHLWVHELWMTPNDLHSTQNPLESTGKSIIKDE